jgi:hypothetical protein
MVLEVIPHYDYEHLMLEGMDLANEHKGYWEIYDSHGKYIDGTFNIERCGDAIR